MKKQPPEPDVWKYDLANGWEALAGRTLADIDTEVAGKLSDGFMRQTTAWFDDRNVTRRAHAGRPTRK